MRRPSGAVPACGHNGVLSAMVILAAIFGPTQSTCGGFTPLNGRRLVDKLRLRGLRSAPPARQYASILSDLLYPGGRHPSYPGTVNPTSAVALPAAMERELKRVKSGRLFLIPGSEDTSGHGTVFFAKFWKQQVQELLQTTPRRAM
jgi:hypothetical protein